MLIAEDDALDPTVSTLSKPGLRFSSCSTPLLTPGLFANGFRIGIVVVGVVVSATEMKLMNNYNRKYRHLRIMKSGCNIRSSRVQIVNDDLLNDQQTSALIGERLSGYAD